MGRAVLDIVVAGNVAEDRSPQGAWVPGGPSLYTARQAVALGARTRLATNLPPGFDTAVLADLDVIATAHEPAPRYANTYDDAGNRTQLLLHEGPPLELGPGAVPEAVDLLLVAPAYHEVAALPPVRARHTGIALQGFLRDHDADGSVRPHRAPLEQVRIIAMTGAIAFLSEEDTADPCAFAAALAAQGVTVLLTRGYRGAVVFVPGESPRDLDAIPAEAVVDPTGAGDCFATALMVRLVETGDLNEACRFGLAAGALAVEGAGLAGIPTREAIETRLGKVAA